MADGNGAAIGDGGGGHFERFNALIDNGWLGVLTEREIKVWMVYERYAKRDGTDAFPKPGTVAHAVGHSHSGQLRVIRKSLEDYGLIRRSGTTGGRDWAQVQLLPPPADATARYQARLASRRAASSACDELTPGSRSDRGPDRTGVVIGPGSELTPGSNSTGQGARIWTGHPGPNARALQIEQSKEQPREQSPPAAPSATPPPAAPPPAKAAKAAAPGKPRPKRPGKRVRTDEEHALRAEVKRRFCDEWWPAEHAGERYPWEETAEKQRINESALWQVFDGLGWNLDHVTQAMKFFARWCAETFSEFRVPLQQLVKHRGNDTRWWLSQAQIYESRTAGKLKLSGANGSSDGNSETPGRDDYAIPAGRPRAARPGAGAGDPGPGAAAAG